MPVQADAVLPKSPTGITGLDEILLGGLPSGRPALFAARPDAQDPVAVTFW